MASNHAVLFLAKELALTVSLILMSCRSGTPVPIAVVRCMKSIVTLRNGLPALDAACRQGMLSAASAGLGMPISQLLAKSIPRDALEILLFYEIPHPASLFSDCVYALDCESTQQSYELLTMTEVFRLLKDALSAIVPEVKGVSRLTTPSATSTAAHSPQQTPKIRPTVEIHEFLQSPPSSDSADDVGAEAHVRCLLLLLIKYASFYSQAAGVSPADRDALIYKIQEGVAPIIQTVFKLVSDNDLDHDLDPVLRDAVLTFEKIFASFSIKRTAKFKEVLFAATVSRRRI
jgi:hypothetical protein